VRKTFSVVLLVAMAALGGSAVAAPADQKDGKSASKDSAFLGTWSGTWTGGSSGRFEMTLSQDAGGKLSGSISPTSDNGGSYTSQFQSVVVEAGTLTAKFQPPDGQVDVTLKATVEGAESKGTYAAHEKSQDMDVDSGTWTAKKK
jgi:hypothetical protein